MPLQAPHQHEEYNGTRGNAHDASSVLWGVQVDDELNDGEACAKEQYAHGPRALDAVLISDPLRQEDKS